MSLPDSLTDARDTIGGAALANSTNGRARPVGPSLGGPVSDATAQARIPDFFIVGHQKCGTTALYTMLRQHPGIFMPDVKEPQFFATDQRSRFSRRGAPRSDMRPRTLDAYLALFAAASAEQRVGEASAQYLRSKVAADAIAELQPAARIIAILREPASFLRSFHLQMVSSRVETETDFRAAIAYEDERRAGRRIPRGCHHPEALMYSEHVRYVEQLRRFRAVFPDEQVLVLVYEDFRRDNETTMRRVQRFLDIDDTTPLETIDTKPVKAVRSMFLHQLLGMGRHARRNPSAASRAERAVNAMTPMFLRNEVFRKRWHRMVYTQPQPADEQFMRELRTRFKPEVEALSNYLGRDLVKQWGYKDL